MQAPPQVLEGRRVLAYVVFHESVRLRDKPTARGMSCAFPAPLKPSAYFRVRPCEACVAPHSDVRQRSALSWDRVSWELSEMSLAV